MADVPPPAAHAKRPRAAAEMHGTADGGWDGDDGSVLSTRLWVGGVAGQTQRWHHRLIGVLAAGQR